MRPLPSQKTTHWTRRFSRRFSIGIVLCAVPVLFVVAQFFTDVAFANSAGSQTVTSGETAKTAITIAASTHPGDLQLGDRSAAVRNLKTQLQKIGYGNSTPPSRRFDRATEETIRQFQANQSLPVNGIADTRTREKIELAVSEVTNTDTAVIENPAAQAAITPVISAEAATASITDVNLQSLNTQTSESASSVAIANPSESTTTKTLPPDIQRIVDRGKLVVSLLNRDNPPFFMLDNSGQLDGSDVRTAQALAKALDVEIEFRRSATTFNEVVQDVYQHNADLAVSKISRTLNRAKQNRFSKPYLNLRQGLLLNRLQLAKDSNGKEMTAMVRQLKGKIGVIKDSSYARFAKQNFPQATIVDYPDWGSVIEAVTKGEILAAYRDELEVKKIVLTRPDAALQLQTISLTDTKDSLAVVLPWESEHLLAFVNQYLETAEDNGDLISNTDDLLEAYSGYFESSTVSN